MNVRMSGLVKIMGSAVVYGGLLMTVFRNGLGNPSHGGPFVMIAMGAPGAVGLAGLIEVVTGTPFQNLATAWDGLKGWQRGVLGTLVVIAAFALMMLGIALFA